MTAPNSAALRRLATTLTADPTVVLRARIGVVSSVVSGGAVDSHTAVNVQVGGSIVPAPYLDSYGSAGDPAVGDLVLVLLVDRSPVILGRIIGLPNF